MAKSKIKILNSEKGYNLAAETYDKKEKYLNSFEQNKLLPLLGNVKNKKILDVGAGTGRLAIALDQQGAEVTAIDVSSAMLNVLRQKSGNNISTVVASAEKLPFESKAFDIVIAAFLVVHLKDPIIFFDEVYRILKSEGIFLVTNINQKEAPAIKTAEGIIKITSYYHRPEKIIGMLEKLAFSIEEEIFTKEKEQWVNQIIVARK